MTDIIIVASVSAGMAGLFHGVKLACRNSLAQMAGKNRETT